jgi:hypothetical protein
VLLTKHLDQELVVIDLIFDRSERLASSGLARSDKQDVTKHPQTRRETNILLIRRGLAAAAKPEHHALGLIRPEILDQLLMIRCRRELMPASKQDLVCGPFIGRKYLLQVRCRHPSIAVAASSEYPPSARRLRCGILTKKTNKFLDRLPDPPCQLIHILMREVFPRLMQAKHR